MNRGSDFIPEGPGAFVHLSRLLGRRLRSADGRFAGRLSDLVAGMTERFPEVEAAVVATRTGSVFLPLGPGLLEAILTGRPFEGVEPVVLDIAPPRFLMRRSLLDRQVVDVQGAKVVRVNDIHLLVHGSRMVLVHVDIGFTGLVRRLGIEKGVRALARLLHREPQDELVSWKYVQPLTTSTGTTLVRLSLRNEQLRRLHPAELADIMEDLDPGERLALVRTMDPVHLADAMEEVEETVQAAIIGDLDTGLAADILEEMEPAAAADVVEMLPEVTQQRVMAAMEDEEREQLERLSVAEEDTAASLMTVEFVSCPEEATAGEALEAVKSALDEIRFISYVYCTDRSGRLSGVVSLRRLLKMPPDSPLAQVVTNRLTTLSPGDGFDETADLFFKFRLLAIPVTDSEGRIEGVVTFEHSFDELLPYYRKLA